MRAWTGSLGQRIYKNGGDRGIDGDSWSVEQSNCSGKIFEIFLNAIRKLGAVNNHIGRVLLSATHDAV